MHRLNTLNVGGVVAVLLCVVACAQPAPQTERIELGATKHELLRIAGQPNDVSRKSMEDGRGFDTYYYAEINTSYVVDTSTGHVCGIELGHSDGICYDCDYGPDAGNCP